MPGRTSGIVQLECRNQSPVKLPFSAMIAGSKLVVMQAFASFSLMIVELPGANRPSLSMFLMDICSL
jgi:hypothetical protein